MKVIESSLELVPWEDRSGIEELLGWFHLCDERLKNGSPIQEVIIETENIWELESTYSYFHDLRRLIEKYEIPVSFAGEILQMQMNEKDEFKKRTEVESLILSLISKSILSTSEKEILKTSIQRRPVDAQIPLVTHPS